MPTMPVSFDQVVRNFAPSWFAAVMGTGVLALGAAALGRYLPPLATLAAGLHWFNVALFVVLLVPWTLRWIYARPSAVGALAHPVVSSFVPTVAIALLVLSVQFMQLSRAPQLALPLWLAGVALALGFSFLILFKQFLGEHVQLDHVTPGMFIPPVGLVVIPVAGAPLATLADPAMQGWILLVCYISLGSGALLWLALHAITLFRMMLHKPIPGQLAPTFWINLGPLGVIPISLIALAEASPFVADKAPFHIVALFLWGFGAWWLVMASVLTFSYWRRGQLPFALSWWAFTFPTGAFAIASFRLSHVLPLPGLFGFGVAAYLLLVLFWSATLARSIGGALNGSLFQPH
jgi:C4-dicarboxylate transporter/malic acid transport protein